MSSFALTTAAVAARRRSAAAALFQALVMALSPE
jgi:hypothetical protein